MSKPIKIDSGIKIPPTGCGGRRGNTKYPFGEMNVGDSFAMPAKTAKDAALLRSAASAAAYRRGYRYVVRHIEEAGKMVARCWRVE